MNLENKPGHVKIFRRESNATRGKRRGEPCRGSSGTRARRNRTISLSDEERRRYRPRLLRINGAVLLSDIVDRTICQDVFRLLDWLPGRSVDLIFADPPYNLSKSYRRTAFRHVSSAEYEEWLESWVSKLPRLLKPTGSLYVCGDWRCSTAMHRVLERHFVVRNRIMWEREKGRGAKKNWKNCSEDIWFATASHRYVFNVDAVKLKRRVIAPYTDERSSPKGWDQSPEGRYRVTHPSNLWTDLTVPFWSVPENTDHPTQKPEKLLARIILASSDPGGVVFDPFLGSGTTSVVAKKLNRHYIGVEIDETYSCLAEKRLKLADRVTGIQGYADGVFWERNSFYEQNAARKTHRARLGLERQVTV